MCHSHEILFLQSIPHRVTVLGGENAQLTLTDRIFWIALGQLVHRIDQPLRHLTVAGTNVQHAEMLAVAAPLCLEAARLQQTAELLLGQNEH